MPVPAVRTGGSPQGQLGVADRRARQQVRAEDDRLPPGLGKLDQGASPRLAAGSRGRRDGDHRRQVGGDPLHAPLVKS